MGLDLMRLAMREAFAHTRLPGHDSLVIRNRDTGDKTVICKTCNLVWRTPPPPFLVLFLETLDKVLRERGRP